MTNEFKIDIINHCWIDNDPENETDECSHGEFILKIAGTDILTTNDGITDWTTCTSVLRLMHHEGNQVIIKEIKKYPSCNDEKVVDYKDLIGVIHLDVYRRGVLKVAKQVKDFYARSRPRKLYDGDVPSNLEFWQEFDGLMGRHLSY